MAKKNNHSTELIGETDNGRVFRCKNCTQFCVEWEKMICNRTSMIALLTILLMTLAACGPAAQPEPTATTAPEPTATTPPPTETPEPAATATEQPTEQESNAEGETRSIEHSLGTTDITGTPETIVALEWTYAEDLLALGIQPAGVADIEGYSKWVDVEPELSDDVADVGTRQEPSLEAIAELDPDLIIGVQFRHEPIYEDLSAIAPTLMFNPYPGEDGPNQYDEMIQTFQTIAQAVNREDEAAQVLEEMRATFDDAAGTLAEAGYEGAPFALAQAFTYEGAAQVRILTDNSMAVQILEQIGLENAWDAGFQQYGFSTVGIEGLSEIESAHFFYVVQDDDNVFQQEGNNAVWNSLEFVQEDRAYPLGGDTWLFGGPLSAEVLVETIVTVMTE